MHGDDTSENAHRGRAADAWSEEAPADERRLQERRPDEQRWFAELVREHYAPALRQAARLLRDAVEAEDCVQEALAEAFSHQAR